MATLMAMATATMTQTAKHSEIPMATHSVMAMLTVMHSDSQMAKPKAIPMATDLETATDSLTETARATEMPKDSLTARSKEKHSYLFSNTHLAQNI